MFNVVNKTPLRAVSSLFLLILLIVVFLTLCWDFVSSHIFPNTTIGLYNKSFWENVLVEAHGMVFDILIIGVVVVWLDTRRSIYNERKNMINELNDMSYLDLPEVNHRKIGLMYRLNKLGVMNFNVDELIISSVRVNGLNVKDSTLNNLKIMKSLISETSFTETTLLRADFSETQIKSTLFLGCKMKKVAFINATAHGVDYSHSNLERAKFINADVQSSIFKECNLREVNFENANLRNANFRGAKYLKAANLLRAKCLDYIVVDDELKNELKSLRSDIKGL
ncbi:pentapeptide repeat-containing protein [Aeromonas rivipollensis]|uniref:Pentapeptide repeat-containing protein n=2 Tax=Aeromonas TaxID=642 RepID=A0AAW9YBA4_9GAMM|nr:MULTISPECIES: pentapeptide repeat-containing protein [Aeromonas]MCK2085972.1 pentapeptide repeat-containing protein [Aeromonas genomosp. paramedia]MCV3289638.1 pentapeptide repeat-containing protein [Aeromonas media]NEX75074.1 pentapeptide repeat-containing protein [Aeromonas rivipollensis]